LGLAVSSKTAINGQPSETPVSEPPLQAIDPSVFLNPLKGSAAYFAGIILPECLCSLNREPDMI
jgi:hypothetical protein